MHFGVTSVTLLSLPSSFRVSPLCTCSLCWVVLFSFLSFLFRTDPSNCYLLFFFFDHKCLVQLLVSPFVSRNFKHFFLYAFFFIIFPSDKFTRRFCFPSLVNYFVFYYLLFSFYNSSKCFGINEMKTRVVIMRHKLRLEGNTFTISSVLVKDID